MNSQIVLVSVTIIIFAGIMVLGDHRRLVNREGYREDGSG
jgi:hypothetical protein